MGGICETYGALFWENPTEFIWKRERNVPRGIYRRRRRKIIK